MNQHLSDILRNADLPLSVSNFIFRSSGATKIKSLRKSCISLNFINPARKSVEFSTSKSFAGNHLSLNQTTSINRIESFTIFS